MCLTPSRKIDYSCLTNSKSVIFITVPIIFHIIHTPLGCELTINFIADECWSHDFRDPTGGNDTKRPEILKAILETVCRPTLHPTGSLWRETRAWL